MHTNKERFHQDHINDDNQFGALTETALEWLIKLHSGSQTEIDWQEYYEWKKANPEQASAANAAEELWENIGPAIKKPSSSKIKKSITNLVFIFGLTGIILSSAIHQNFIKTPSSLFADFRTTTGEYRTIVLTDGSRLQLDTSTNVDFDSEKRQLTLYNGQIHVDVASIKDKPFEVIAGKGVIRALGTGFNVKHLNNSTEVIVTEHTVKISQNNESIILSDGKQLHYDTATGLGTATIANLRSQTAWQRGHLIFDNTSLEEVIREAQRYNSSKIIFIDQKIKALPITGIFNTDDTDNLLSTIEKILPIKIYYLPWVTIIESRT